MVTGLEPNNLTSLQFFPIGSKSFSLCLKSGMFQQFRMESTFLGSVRNTKISKETDLIQLNIFQILNRTYQQLIFLYMKQGSGKRIFCLFYLGQYFNFILLHSCSFYFDSILIFYLHYYYFRFKVNQKISYVIDKFYQFYRLTFFYNQQNQRNFKEQIKYSVFLQIFKQQQAAQSKLLRIYPKLMPRLQSQESIDQDLQLRRTNSNPYNYEQKKQRMKRKFYVTNKMNEIPKNSNYSTSSRYTSFDKGGNQISDPDIVLFKQSQSAYYNQLKEKYLQRDAPPEKIRQEMLLTLQRKVSELQALRIHRDELKFISNNNPYNNPIKIGFAVLRQKAKTQQKVKTAIQDLRKDIKDIDEEFSTMTEYYNFVKNSLAYTGDEDLIIDTQQEQKLMIENLQNETNHLFRELRQSDKKNAKEIKQMQMEIGNLRISIKQKQDKIRDLKSKICTAYIKLHSRNNSNKQKNVSLSIRKFNNERHSKLQQAFVGNKNFKTFSKQIIEKVNQQDELTKIIFFSQEKQGKQNITFKCVYKNFQGKHHKHVNEDNPQMQMTNNTQPKKVQQPIEVKQTEINVKYLLSIKFFLKNKIVGVQCRIKTDRGNKHVTIGNCKSNIKHQLLTLINKKVVTMSSFWHHKDMIGVGVWYSNKLQPKIKLDSSRQRILKNVKSEQTLTKQSYDQYYAK